MSDDNFLNDLNTASKQIKSINNDLKIREEKAQNNQSVVKDNQAIQQQLTKLQTLIDSLEGKIRSYQNGDASIPSGEIDRRRQNVNNLKNKVFEMNQQFRSARGFLEKDHVFKPSNQQKYSDNLDRDTATVTQLQSDRHDLERQFNDRIEGLSDATKTLKNDQVQMSDELGFQNEVLLPRIEAGVDNNHIKFTKANRKLAQILKKGSDCKLWLCIIIELVILVLLLLYSS